MNRYNKYPHIQPVRRISKATTDIQHVLTKYETIDQLALKYYNNPNLEWVIMCANPDWFFGYEIPAGTTLRIPFPLSRVFDEWGITQEV
jgi:hypothetical protein